MRAGFIPQCIPSRLPDADAVFELATLSNAKAVLHHSSIPAPSDPRFFIHEVRPLCVRDIVPGSELTDLDVNPDDICVIYHTSGSTGKLPKLVKVTGRRMDAMVLKCIRKSPVVAPWR